MAALLPTLDRLVSSSSGAAVVPSTTTKKDKGRLKKLRKRAEAIQNKGDKSGITNLEDWLELKRLEQQQQTSQQVLHNHTALNHNKTPGPLWSPAIVWRNGKIQERVEATDHRDILFHFMATTKPGKKRTRVDVNDEDENDDITRVSIPSCVTLHNPAAAEHIGVIELHSPYDLEWISTLKQLLNELGGNNNNNSSSQEGRRHRPCLASDTRWFQGPQPQCMSRIMMYSSNKSKTNFKSEQINNKQELYSKLLELKATKEEMKKEKYPQRNTDQSAAASSETTTTTRTTLSSVKHPADVSLEDARILLKDYLVSLVKPQNEQPDATSEYSLVPYVASLVRQVPDSDLNPGVYAVDCEMVQTVAGMELARITVMELESYSPNEGTVTRLVWDTVVKPTNPVVDYLTAYSGMTPDILNNATVYIEQVQWALVSLLRPTDILIGHSLENDLRALRLVHDTIVDTALVFRPAHRRCKYSLRMLAAKLLRIQIQNSNQPHCSQEDATTALQLAVRRAVEGPAFGIQDKSHTNRLHWMAKSDGSSNNSTTVCVGPSTWLQQHVTSQPNAIHALDCETIQDANHKAVSSWLTGPTRRARLVWAQWHLTPKDAATLQTILQDLLSKLPPTALLLIAVQFGWEEADHLTQLRAARRNPKSTLPWTESDEEQWKLAVDHCRHGAAYWF